MNPKSDDSGNPYSPPSEGNWSRTGNQLRTPVATPCTATRPRDLVIAKLQGVMQARQNHFARYGNYVDEIGSNPPSELRYSIMDDEYATRPNQVVAALDDLSISTYGGDSISAVGNGELLSTPTFAQGDMPSIQGDMRSTSTFGLGSRFMMESVSTYKDP
jgi:hypothetical protein